MTFDLPEPLGRPRRAEYTPADFRNFNEARTLAITPKFQRRSVWQAPQRSWFIDSLLRGLPVPPIFLRETQNEDFSGMRREVIDGQQRISTILDYLGDDFALSRSLLAPWAGMRFSELPDAARARILTHHFSCEVFANINDAAVLEIFSRMNSNSVPLNKQELRNGRYFGQFKSSCYQLALEHLEFWRRNRIFTEQAIARMLEVELTSELVVMLIAGLQDKKASIDFFYAEYDEEFEFADEVRDRFRRVIDEISETFDESISTTTFRRPPLFYSLFGAVAHRLFSVPELELASPERALRLADRRNLRAAVELLTEQVDAAREDLPIPRRFQAFVNACMSQTDNVNPRRTRLTAIYSEAELG